MDRAYIDDITAGDWVLQQLILPEDSPSAVANYLRILPQKGSDPAPDVIPGDSVAGVKGQRGDANQFAPVG